MVVANRLTKVPEEARQSIEAVVVDRWLQSIKYIEGLFLQECTKWS